MTVRGSPEYEEIGDAKSSFTYTKNSLYGPSTTGVACKPISDHVPEMPTGVHVEPPKLHDEEAKTHNYELIQTAEYQSIENAYKVQHNSAYGVSSVDMSYDSSMSYNFSSRSHDPSCLSRPKSSCKSLIMFNVRAGGWGGGPKPV